MSIIVNGIELTEVIYAGVNLDIVKVKKGTAEAVTVFEKITQLATPQNVSADGTVVSWDEVENATSYQVLADGTSIGTVENVTEDALAGTWVFNDTLSFNELSIPSGTRIKFSLMFESGNPTALGTLNVFDGIEFLYASDYDLYSLYYTLHIAEGSLPEPIDGNYYYSKSVPDEGIVAGWGDDAFKTIVITSKLSEVTNGEQLLAWLQANATKQ